MGTLDLEGLITDTILQDVICRTCFAGCVMQDLLCRTILLDMFGSLLRLSDSVEQGLMFRGTLDLEGLITGTIL